MALCSRKRCLYVLPLMAVFAVLSFKPDHMSAQYNRQDQLTHNIASVTSPSIVTSPLMTSHSQDTPPRGVMSDPLWRPDAVVPNIVHYVWFGVHDFTFLNYLSVLSVHKFQKPDAIFFHCDNIPTGKFWDDAIPFLKIIHLDQPGTIYNNRITRIHHQSDVARLQILIKHGGIYLDTDVILVRSLDPLRHYDVTMGKEVQSKLCAGMMLGRPNAKFYRMCLQKYQQFNPHQWAIWSGKKPWRLSLRFPGLVHVEPWRLTTPDWTRARRDLWRAVVPWRDLYLVHVHYETGRDISPTSIRSMSNTFGEVARHVYDRTS